MRRVRWFRPKKRRRKSKSPLAWTWEQAQEFYRSTAWRRKRWEIIERDGRRCTKCGARPQPDNEVVINVDHKIPLRMRPDLALESSNLRTLCDACNHGKGNRLDQSS